MKKNIVYILTALVVAMLVLSSCVSPKENQPPTVSLELSADSVNVGETVTATVTASDPENGPLTGTINWDDGTTEPLSFSGGVAVVTHSYSEPGTYDVEVTVTDDAGKSASDKKSISVVAAPPSGVIKYTITPDREAYGWAFRIGPDATDIPVRVTVTEAEGLEEGTYKIQFWLSKDEGETFNIGVTDEASPFSYEIEEAPATEATYVLRVIAVDLNDQKIDGYSVDIPIKFVEGEKPSAIELEMSPATDVTGGFEIREEDTVLATLTATDVSGISEYEWEVKKDGSVVLTGNGNTIPDSVWEYTEVIFGATYTEYTVVATAVDKYGTEKGASWIVRVTDETAPEVNLSVSGTTGLGEETINGDKYYYTKNDTVTLNIEVIEKHNYLGVVYFDSATASLFTGIGNETYPVKLSLGTDGASQLVINVWDIANNATQVAATIVKDTNPPTFTLSGIATGILYATPVAGSPIIDNYVWKIEVDNVSNEAVVDNNSGTITILDSFDNEQATITVKIYDKAGNFDVATYTGYIDNTAPRILSCELEGLDSNLVATLTILATDAQLHDFTETTDGTITLPVTGEATSTGEASYTIGLEASSTWIYVDDIAGTVTVVVKDASGNTSKCVKEIDVSSFLLKEASIISVRLDDNTGLGVPDEVFIEVAKGVELNDISAPSTPVKVYSGNVLVAEVKDASLTLHEVRTDSVVYKGQLTDKIAEGVREGVTYTVVIDKGTFVNVIGDSAFGTKQDIEKEVVAQSFAPQP